MRYPFIVIISFSCIMHLHGQTLERQVLASAGNYTTASWGSLSFTTGDVMTNTLSISSEALTQGFQQPLPQDINVSVKIIESVNPSILIFPNPVTDKLYVQVETDNANKYYSVSIMDIYGQKLIVPFQTDNPNEKIYHFVFDLQHLTMATYLIAIYSENGTCLKTSRFTKINQ